MRGKCIKYQTLKVNSSEEEKNLPIVIKVKCKTNKLLMLGSIFVDLYLHSFDPIQFCSKFFGAVLVGETKNIPPARHTQTHVRLESGFRDDCNKNSAIFEAQAT